MPTIDFNLRDSPKFCEIERRVESIIGEFDEGRIDEDTARRRLDVMRSEVSGEFDEIVGEILAAAFGKDGAP